jgi:carbamoyltransferase
MAKTCAGRSSSIDWVQDQDATPMTTILGISAFYHDSAAALVVDGRIVAAAQEERFSRKKHDPGFPANAVTYCLQAGNLHPEDLDYVAFYDKPLLKFDRLLETYLAFAPAGFRSFRLALPVWLKDKIHLRRLLRRQLTAARRARFVFTEHHESHAASAFFPSPFDTSAILTLDGVGEWSTATLGTGEGNRIRLLRELKFPHSAGLLYSAFIFGKKLACKSRFTRAIRSGDDDAAGRIHKRINPINSPSSIPPRRAGRLHAFQRG